MSIKTSLKLDHTLKDRKLGFMAEEQHMLDQGIRALPSLSPTVRRLMESIASEPKYSKFGFELFDLASIPWVTSPNIFLTYVSLYLM